MCVLVVQSCPTLYNPVTAACQVPLSMEFSSQEYWSGLPFPSPGNLLDPWINPVSPALQEDSLSVAQSCLFATPWTAAHQASQSNTNPWSPPKLMSIESVMPPNHLLSPSPPAFNLSQHQGLFQGVSSSYQVL